jgi:hypothetical protein
MTLIQFIYSLFMCSLKSPRDNYTDSTNIFISQVFTQTHNEFLLILERTYAKKKIISD